MEYRTLDITIEEANKLITWLLNEASGQKKHHLQVRNLLMTLLMLDAGLRVGEVVQLRISDLWMFDAPVESVTLTKDQTKTQRERTIPLSERIREAIILTHNFYWPMATERIPLYAFYGSDPKCHLTTRHVRLIISSLSLMTFGRRIHPHTLRHTFATRLMRKTNIRVVQQLLGHASLQSTQIYTHPNQQDLQTAIKNL
jgi:site-specific recombinase XerD